MCSVLTQMGCTSGEKCTWFHDDMSAPPIGHIGCASDGSVALGGACAYGAAGATGFDDCVGGAVCVGGVCEAICDHQGGAPMCGTNFACVRISGLFGPAGGATPPAAGVCEPSCDPLADNDFDGAGPDVKTGTACPGATEGCYAQGNIFTCAPPASGSETLVHRQEITGQLYSNSCHPGYTIAFANDATGSMKTLCYSFCAPGNSFGSMGTTTTPPPATQLPNGKAPNTCKTGVNSRGRTGNFGDIPNGTPGALTVAAPGGAPGSNGEHCMYSWQFEVDAAGMLTRSPYSDTVGFCFDHAKYGPDDFDGDPATATSPLPACSNLKLKDDVQYDASNAACIDSVTAGFPAAAIGKTVQGTRKDKGFKFDVVFPMLNKEFALPFSPR